ncbi:MAG TPA: DUF1003 domain-containing protein [Armatimonadota bacterium]
MTEERDRLGPAGRYQHDHPPVRNVHELFRESMTPGQRIADRVAAAVGSWPFIITQSLLLAAWIAFNVYLVVMERARPGYLRAWDPYPFILLNLMLSFQAAYTGPVVMMSQNRQGEKDRLMAQNDYEVNQKAEREIQVVLEHLVHQDGLILKTLADLEALMLEPTLRDLAAKVDALQRELERGRASGDGKPGQPEGVLDRREG